LDGSASILDTTGSREAIVSFEAKSGPSAPSSGASVKHKKQEPERQETGGAAESSADAWRGLATRQSSLMDDIKRTQQRQLALRQARAKGKGGVADGAAGQQDVERVSQLDAFQTRLDARGSRLNSAPSVLKH